MPRQQQTGSFSASLLSASTVVSEECLQMGGGGEEPEPALAAGASAAFAAVTATAAAALAAAAARRRARSRPSARARCLRALSDKGGWTSGANHRPAESYPPVDRCSAYCKDGQAETS